MATISVESDSAAAKPVEASNVPVAEYLRDIRARYPIYDQGSSNNAWAYAGMAVMNAYLEARCGCGHPQPAYDAKNTVCVDCATKMRNPSMIVDKRGRNSLCHCGSGKKFKQCCIDRPTGVTGL